MTALIKAAAAVALGDTVLFKSLHKDEMGNGAEEVPAIVTRVWTPTCVNLRVIRDADAPISVTSIDYEKTAPGTKRSWRFREDAKVTVELNFGASDATGGSTSPVTAAEPAAPVAPAAPDAATA